MSRRGARPVAIGVAILILALAGTASALLQSDRESAAPFVVPMGTDSVAVDSLVELDRLTLGGVAGATGLAMTADGSQLFVADGNEPGLVASFAFDDSGPEPIASSPMAKQAGAIAVDPTTKDLVVAVEGPASLEWRQVGSELDVVHRHDSDLALAFSDGVAFDRTRSLIHGLSDGIVSSFAYDPTSNEIGSIRVRVDVGTLPARGGTEGLSVDPVTGSMFVGALETSQIFELDRSGELVRVLDLNRSAVQPTAFTVAASSDPTDISGSTSVFVVDAVASSAGSSIVELGVAEAARIGPSVVDTAELVQTISLSNIPNPSPDSSAITWLPVQGQLLVADSEVEEYDFYTGVSTWTIDLDGTITPVEIAGGLSSAEPTGMTVDGSNQIYITDDVAQEIHLLDLGPDGILDGGDGSISGFSTLTFGCADPEDVAYDSRRSRLYVVDGNASEVFIIDPGPNGRFEGSGDDIVEQFDVSSAGIGDPEGIAYDPDRDTFLIVDREDTTAVEFGPSGGVLRRVDLSAADSTNLAGVTWAPGSSGGTSLWAVDRGIDGPFTVDGRAYEFVIPPLADGAPAPSITVPTSVVERRLNPAEAVRVTVDVENRGTEPLRVTQVRVFGTEAGAVTVVSTSVPDEILAADRSEIVLEVAPGAEVPPGSRLLIESTDPHRPRAVVQLVLQG